MNTGFIKLKRSRETLELLNDYKKYGLTRQQYRSAMKRLGMWGLATFKSTTHGTVATLLGCRIYDINEASVQPAGNQPPTNAQPTANHQPTTNKKEKKEKNEKKYSIHSDEWRLSELLLEGGHDRSCTRAIEAHKDRGLSFPRTRESTSWEMSDPTALGFLRAQE